MHGGLDPSILVGGIARNLGEDGSSYRLGKGKEFVIEGDEYDSAYFDKTAKFLKYLPDIAVINNVEFDHADIYADIDAVRLAFRRLVNLVPRSGLLLLGADSPDALALKKVAVSPVETFGLSESADWRATDVTSPPRGSRSTCSMAGRDIATLQIPLFGLHNVRNAMASIAVAHALVDTRRDHCGGSVEIPGREAPARDFRRSGRRDGVRRLCASSRRRLRRRSPGLRAANPHRRIWAIFEPRSASSSRRVFQQDFARAFGPADEVIIAPGVSHEPAGR